jgi:steroid delta-isomerase
MAIQTSDKVRAVDAYIAAYNCGDLAAILDVFADDATVEDPVGSPLLVGKDAIATLMGQGVAMRASLALIGAVRCAGDYAAFPLAVTFEGAGGPARIEVIDIFKFNAAGKVAEMRAFFGPENMDGL